VRADDFSRMLRAESPNCQLLEVFLELELLGGIVR